MYIWRDNSVRSHGSRETGGESGPSRHNSVPGFSSSGFEEDSFLKGSGLHSPAIHVLVA